VFNCLRLFLVLKLLTDRDNVPAMINCRHGKDRTGVIVALALSCVGWTKDEVVADYALSQVAEDGFYFYYYLLLLGH